MVETQLCKFAWYVRHVRWTCVFYTSKYFIFNMVFVNQIYDMIINTQFHKIKWFARVLCFILMKDIGR